MAMAVDIENLVLPSGNDRIGQFFMSLIPALVARGWIVAGSGNGTGGTTFENSGQTGGPYNVFDGSWVTGGVSWDTGTAASFSRANAWLRMREPSPSTREIVFQRSGSGASFSGYMSKVLLAPAGFLANDATLTAPPTAAGTTLGPSGNSAWVYGVLSDAAVNELVANLIISDVAKAGDVWPFTLTFHDSLLGLTGGLIYESLLDSEAGDTQPFVYKTSNSPFLAVGNPSQNAWTSIRAVGGAADSTIDLNYQQGEVAIPGATQLKDVLGRLTTVQPLVFTSDKVFKGRMEHILWNPTYYSYPHVSVEGSSYWVHWGNLLLPWVTVVTPGV